MKINAIAALSLAGILLSCGVNSADKESIIKLADQVNVNEAAPPPVKSLQENVGYKSNLAKDYSKSDAVGKGVEMPDVSLFKKHIIYTADIKFRCEDMNKTSNKIDDVVKKYGAFVSKSDMVSTASSIETQMSIKVLPENFADVIKELSGNAQVMDYKKITSNDVTSDYIDVETRIKTKKEVEARYIDILKTKAKTVEEVLAAENEIRVIHEEIEARTGQLNYMKDQSAFSTINLVFYEPILNAVSEPIVDEFSFGFKIKEAFSSGWKVIVNIFIGFVYVWPLWLILIAIYIVLRKYVFGKKLKTKAPSLNNN